MPRFSRFKLIFITLLAAAVFSGLGPARTTNAWRQEAEFTPVQKMKPIRSRPSLEAVPDAGVFVSRVENGRRICREATAQEIRLFAEHDTQNLRVISSLSPNQAQGLKITLRATAQLDGFPEAKAAFIKAAQTWESLIKTPITVIIDVDYGPNRFGTPYPNGVLGSTSTQQLSGTGLYGDLRDGLIATASSAQEKAFFETLPTGQLPTDIGTTTNGGGTSAQLRAIGLLDPVPDVAGEASQGLGQPPAIGFNSNFKFDFDPTNGIDSDKFDFDATAIHEIGHALGFSSNVGLKELVASVPVTPTIWDLFRFRPGVTSATFSTAQRIQSSGGTQVFFSGKEVPLSTGRPNGTGGDGAQSSHWKERGLAGQYIGVMDPNGAPGDRDQITNNDLLAIETFGYALTTPLGGGDTTPPTVSNVTPKGGESVKIGEKLSISWESSDNKGLAGHSIALSKDSGATFPTTVATGLGATTKSFAWDVAFGSETTKGRIRVTATDTDFNTGTATSAADFTIAPRQDGLAGPTGLTATVQGNNVALSWTAPAAREFEPNQATTVILRPGGIPAGNYFDEFINGDEDGGFTSGTKLVIGEQLTPTQYPATLKSVLYLSINSAFTSGGRPFPSAAGAKMRLYVFNGPTGADFTKVAPKNLVKKDVDMQREPKNFNAVKEPDASGPGDFNEFPIDDYTITEGSFFVAIQYVDAGTSALLSDGSNFIYVYEGSDPATGVVSGNNGTSFTGIPAQINFSSGASVTPDFGFLGRAQFGSTAPKLTGYNVYRSTTSPPAVTAANKVGSVAAGTTTFTDSPTVANGNTKYFYVVTATYDSPAESGPSNEANATPGTAGGETVPPTVKVLAPNGGETVNNGGVLNISWESSDNVGVTSHNVDLSTDGGTSFGTSVAAGLGGTVKTFAFNVPSTLTSTTARIRVTARDAAGNAGTDASDANFTIKSNDTTAPAVAVTAPNGGEKVKLKSGKTFSITWTASDAVGIVSQEIFLSTDGGATFPTRLATGVGGTVRTFTLTNTLAGKLNTKTARVRVTAKDAAGNEGRDDSNANFTLKSK